MTRCCWGRINILILTIIILILTIIIISLTLTLTFISLTFTFAMAITIPRHHDMITLQCYCPHWLGWRGITSEDAGTTSCRQVLLR